MPRRRLGDEREARAQGAKPPKRRGNKPPTTPLQMALRRLAMVQLISMGASDDEIEQSMLVKFPDMAPTSMGKLRQEALAIVKASILETPDFERAKQKMRLIRHISKAERKESWSAVSSLERIYADVVGTIKPVDVNVNVNHSFVPAFNAVLARLTDGQLEQLAAGEDAPLGGVVEATLEPAQEEDAR